MITDLIKFPDEGHHCLLKRLKQLNYFQFYLTLKPVTNINIFIEIYANFLNKIENIQLNLIRYTFF